MVSSQLKPPPDHEKLKNNMIVEWPKRGRRTIIEFLRKGQIYRGEGNPSEQDIQVMTILLIRDD